MATVPISEFFIVLHQWHNSWYTKVQLFYERAKGRCIFHYCKVTFEIGLSSICDIMSFPISSFASFLCSSAKVVHQPLKVERPGGKPFRAESSSCGEYSSRKPFPFQCLYSEMQTATEMSDWRKCRRRQTDSIPTGSYIDNPFVCCSCFYP